MKKGGFWSKNRLAARVGSTIKIFATPEQFGVDSRQFRQLPLAFQVRGNAGARLIPLGGSSEQKLSDPAGSQALHQIIKRAVLESPAATTVLFSAG